METREGFTHSKNVQVLDKILNLLVRLEFIKKTMIVTTNTIILVSALSTRSIIQHNFIDFIALLLNWSIFKIRACLIIDASNHFE